MVGFDLRQVNAASGRAVGLSVLPRAVEKVRLVSGHRFSDAVSCSVFSNAPSGLLLRFPLFPQPATLTRFTSPRKKKGGLPWPPFFSNFVSGLDGLYVLRLPALGALDDIELDLLTFLQAAEAV